MKIIDDLLSPWIVVVDGENFVLCQEKEYVDKKGEPYIQQQQQKYFYDLGSLIKKVIKIKMEESKETLNLEQAFQRHQEISDKITSKLKPLK